jgi:membrane-bound lytic murein transglycosylase MltF
MVTLFQRYGEQYSLPYLLVAAQAYQESGLDHSVRSPVGAVGVMQIKPATAAGAPISIPNVQVVDANIHAGVKFLRSWWIDTTRTNRWTRPQRGYLRWLLTTQDPLELRAYGKAKEEGLDPNRWFNNVELIAAREIGRETVQYVSNIYKYYLAYKMVTEQRDKGAHNTRAGGQSRSELAHAVGHLLCRHGFHALALSKHTPITSSLPLYPGTLGKREALRHATSYAERVLAGREVPR